MVHSQLTDRRYAGLAAAAIAAGALVVLALASCGGPDGTEGETRPFLREGRAGLVIVEGTEAYRDGEWRKHGDFIFRDDRGSVIATGRYVDGLEEGPWQQVYEDGATGRGSFVRGERSGPWETFHRRGGLQDKGSYEGGMRVGRWLSYRHDGKRLREAEYDRGELNGRVVWYGPDGLTIDYERSGIYRKGKRSKPLPEASQ